MMRGRSSFPAMGADTVPIDDIYYMVWMQPAASQGKIFWRLLDETVTGPSIDRKDSDGQNVSTKTAPVWFAMMMYASKEHCGEVNK